MFILKILTFSLLSSSLLYPTTYENATNKKSDKWHVLEYFSKGVITNIYDKNKKSRVIKFKGDSTKSVYILTPKHKNFKRKKGEDILTWEMNYREDFVIMIGMQTVKGKRYLIYTSGDENSYLQYGLGVEATSGKWKKYSRNLQKDLERSDQYNRIITVDSFVIKGSGMMDNIKMVKSEEKSRLKTPKESKIKKDSKREEKQSENKKKIEEPKKIEHVIKKSTKPPIIYINGENPLILKKGERYIEEGATARNVDGTPVMVSISEDIDIFKEGEYSVLYMATNSGGNTAIDRRVVRVGNVVEKHKDNKKSSKNNRNLYLEEEVPLPPIDIDSENIDIDLEQRALEILDWEKQLALREQEMERRQNYPSHPGM